LVSCCFFKRNTSYYKDFSRYIIGIEKLYYNVIKNFKNFSVRLFIDNSIYTDTNIMSKLNKLNKLEIVLYDCPMYKDNIYHQGLFGTMIRFFPLFDFPNNDANIVIVSDIDDSSFTKYINLFKILKNNIKDHYIIKYSNAGRMFKNKELFNHIYKNTILDYIKPQEIIYLKQIDYHIIINFLKNLDSNIKYSYYINKNLVKNDNYISKYENNGHFIYGIDEYFLNNEYLKYIIDHKLPFIERLNFNIFNPYYYQINVRNEKWLNKDKKNFELIINKILKYLKLKPEHDINNNFDIINNIIYQNNKTALNLKYKLYKMFIKNMNKKRYKFLFNVLYNKLLLSEKYIGIYEFNEIKFYNSKNKDFFIKKLEFNDSKKIKLQNILKKYN
jgi:uncharacterized surface protein with fasciclin (FAS1) repeats